MHEYSVARTLLKQVMEVCAANGGRSVTEVRVEAGRLSGVTPDLLRLAFTQLTSDSNTADSEVLGAQLIIDEVDLLAKCFECEHSFTVEAFEFRCPKCRGRVRILQGDQLLLNSVSIETGDAANADTMEKLS